MSDYCDLKLFITVTFTNILNSLLKTLLLIFTLLFT